jgi:hypothetical protein
MNKRKLAAETAMLYTAQQLVDRWLRAHNRGPFNRAVTQAEEQQWDDDPTKDEHRRAFRHVANAIRLGKGHAIQNPAPLLRIMRDSIRHGVDLLPNGRQGAATTRSQ